MTVAVLGTGIMGAPIARNLLAAGQDIRVWNRTRAKADALASEARSRRRRRGRRLLRERAELGY